MSDDERPVRRQEPGPREPGGSEPSDPRPAQPPPPDGHEPPGARPLWLETRPNLVLRRVFLFNAVAIVLLWVLDFHVNYSRGIDLGPIRRLFNTAREDGLASFYMVGLTLATAAIGWLVFATLRGMQASVGRRTGWCLVALFFTYMAVDDGAQIHERVGSAFKIVSERAAAAGGSGLLDRFPSYPWQVLFLPFFAVAGLFVAVFTWRELGDRVGRALVLGGLSCFAFAVGLDFMEGLQADHPWNLPAKIAERFEGLEAATRSRFRQGAYESLRHFSKSTEECIEMLGMTLFLVAFLRRWMSLCSSWGLRFTQPRGNEAA